MRVVEGRPALPISRFVRAYRLREGLLSDPVHRVFAARNSHFIEFALGDRPVVRPSPDRDVARVPVVTVVGTQAMGRVELVMQGMVRTFTICFRPTGMHRLFGTPMAPIAGQGIEAAAVLGTRFDALAEQLGAASDFATMMRVSDTFLAPLAERAAIHADPALAHLTRAIEHSLGQSRVPNVDQLAEACHLSVRSIERRFKDSVGVSPRRYLRVARLHVALDLRDRRPTATWGEIAADAGYFDQMHLVHDMKALGGAPPQRLFDELQPLFQELRMTGIY